MAEIVPYQQKAPVPTPDAAEQHQYLTFELGGELFAIGILAIKEIIEFGGLTTVPMMPEFIRGVINLRGAVVPVVDLSARFGRPPSTITRRSCIVIIESRFEEDSQDIGVIVDTVQEVLEIPPAEIEPPPTFGTRIRPDFIQGMGKLGNRFVIILNLARILSVDEMSVLAQVSTDPNPTP